METPLAAPNAHRRKLPAKRPLIDSSGSPSASVDIDTPLNALVNDNSVPGYLRSVVLFLVEERKRLSDLYRELHEEVTYLRAENTKLKSSQGDNSQTTPTRDDPPAPSMVSPAVDPPASRTYEDVERARSLIIAGIPESRADLASIRVVHDFNCLREIMDFLNIDCSIVCAYRMGRFNQSYPRLLKVVLPASFFAKQMLRRAPHLRFFKAKGLYIRPSLPKEERDRLKREREARRSTVHSQNCNVHGPGSRPVQSCNDPPVVAPSSTQDVSLASGNRLND